MTKEPIRILLVDDDEDDYVLTRDLIVGGSGDRFHLDWVDTYGRAVEAIDRKEHDIYLFDYRLGEQTGLELLQYSIDSGIRAPIILLTAQGDRDVDMAAMEMGASDYLEKRTLSAELLERSIRYALERVLMKEERQETEKKLLAITDAAADGIVLMDNDANISYWNPGAERIFGYSPEEAIGREMHLLIAPEEFHGDYREGFKRFRETGQGPAVGNTLEFPAIRKNGDRFPIEVSISSVKLSGKWHAAGIIRDISDRKRMEKELVRASKFESISILAGGVAHEFNNSLMGIMGNIELLKMELPEDERRDRYFEAMNSSGHRMSRLTDQLLAYAQGGKYQPRDLKLDGFLIETLPILQHDFKPTVRVEKHFSRDIAHIRADNAQMQMALSVILANSNEAIEDEGLIRITAENKDIDEDFAKQHPGLKPGSYVCLIIEDDGKGMDEETKDRIFEPFFTTKFQGRGMGMAAVYGIVKNHDGWISVDSEPGKGTVVRIYLPAISAESKKQGAKAAAQPDVELVTGEGTVLMIEDEEVVIEVTQAMLERLGYRVMVARTGNDAIHITETFDGQIDLALLDIKLPDMEGGKVYPRIMEARPDLKVIVFSGFAIEGPA
ncbi:MAG: response regulator, partial [Deltaproteobacteria bacterium]|nr:response regulator [Deltaproteobacteria bacterium]